MHTTKITRTLALAGFGSAGKLSHTYCCLLLALVLFVATSGKLNWGKRALTVFVLCAATAIALPAQTFTTLLSFDGTDGSQPSAAGPGPRRRFLRDHPGGQGVGGTVFKITPSGTLTTLYNFCPQVGFRTAVVPRSTDWSRPPMGTSTAQRDGGGANGDRDGLQNHPGWHADDAIQLLLPTVHRRL